MMTEGYQPELELELMIRRATDLLGQKGMEMLERGEIVDAICQVANNEETRYDMAYLIVDLARNAIIQS